MHRARPTQKYRPLVLILVLAALCRSMIAPGYMLSLDGAGLPSLVLCPVQNPGLSNWLQPTEHHHHASHEGHETHGQASDSLPSHGEGFTACSFWGGSLYFVGSHFNDADESFFDDHRQWLRLSKDPYLKQLFHRPYSRGPPISKAS